MVNRVDGSLFLPFNAETPNSKKRQRNPEDVDLSQTLKKQNTTPSPSLNERVSSNSPPPRQIYNKTIVDAQQAEIERCWKYPIGTYLTKEEYEKLKDIDNHTPFQTGEVALVIRGKDETLYQFVMVADQIGDWIVFFESKDTYVAKRSTFLYKIKPLLPGTEFPISSQELVYDESRAKTLDGNYNPRQVKRGPIALLSCYNPDHSVKINGTKYYIVDSGLDQFSDLPIVAFGGPESGTIIAIDPKNSPLLNACFNTLKDKILEIVEYLGMPLTTEQILSLTIKTVKQQFLKVYIDAVKNVTNTNGNHVSLPDKNGNIHAFRVVSLEAYLKAKIGSSLQQTLMTCYLLHKLIVTFPSQPILKGIVQMQRFNFSFTEGYYCATFIPSKVDELKQRWFVDPIKGKCINFALLSGQQALDDYDFTLVDRIINLTKDAAQVCKQKDIDEVVTPYQIIPSL